MADNKRIAKNTIFLYFRMFLVMGVTLYTSRIVLGALGVEDFGIYNVVGSIVTMFAFINSALGGATSRFFTFELGRNNHEELKKIFSCALVAHIAIALVVFILAETVGLWFVLNKLVIPDNRAVATQWVYQLSIVAAMFILIRVPYNAAIIAYEKMKIYAYIGIVEVVLQLIVAYIVAVYYRFDRMILYASLILGVQVLVSMFYKYYCTYSYPSCRFRFCRDKTIYRNILSYSGYDLIGSISTIAQGQGLNLLLNMFFGPVVNAARGIAYQVQGGITQFSTNFMMAVRPQIIKLYASGKENEMMRLVYNSSCFSFYLMLMVVTPICLEVNYILTLWLVKYPEHTEKFIILVILLCLIQTLKTPRATVFHATGKVKLSNIIVGGVLCMALPLAYVSLKLGYSPESVFWCANITMAASEIVSCFVLRKYIRYSIKDYLLKVHARCFFVGICSLLLPLFISNRMSEGFIRLIVTCIISVISVSFFSFFMGMNRKMRTKIINVIRMKISIKEWNI